MDSQTLQRIKDVLGRSQHIVVATGKNPSVDDMGAALALYLTLQGMNKDVSVVSASEPIVEISNLVGINKVKTAYEGSGADLVVSFPYKEGEIEKVSYTIENDFLNIVVKAGEQGLSFSEQDVKYTRGGGGQLDLLVTVGAPRFSDLQQLFPADALKEVTVINIDNKQENQGYGDIVLVSPRFSSVSEQMAQLMADLATEPDVDIAQNLLDGISYATENFQSPRTTYLAFEMAGILMRQGAVRSRVGMPQQPQRSNRQDFPQQMGGGQQAHQQQQRRQPQQQHGQQQRQPQQDRRQQFDNNRRQQHAQGGQQQQSQQQSQPLPQQQPVQQVPQSQPQQPAAQPDLGDRNPPSDWLTPKVYKGSSNV